MQESKTLTSWKEIAAYLKVAVRTAQLWEEQRGLPVQRVPGKRSMVRAQVDDLERWLATRSDVPEMAGALASVPRMDRRRWVLGAAGGLGGVAVLLAAMAFRKARGEIATVEVEGERYRALDRNGEPLWAKVSTEDGRSREIRYGYGGWPQNVWVGDLLGNGRRVVVMTIPGDNGRVACIDARGNELWSFICQRTVRTAVNADGYAPPYMIRGFAVLPPARGENARRVVVMSSHATYFPSQVAMLDCTGKVLREYWHSGHLYKIRTVQLAPGFRVLLGGLNNALRQAMLVVLDPETFSGASDDGDEKYRLLVSEQERGVQRFVFPRTEFGKRRVSMNQVSDIRVGGDGFEVHVDEAQYTGATVVLSYAFTPELQFRGLHLSSMTEPERKELMADFDESKFVPRQVR